MRANEIASTRGTSVAARNHLSVLEEKDHGISSQYNLGDLSDTSVSEEQPTWLPNIGLVCAIKPSDDPLGQSHYSSRPTWDKRFEDIPNHYPSETSLNVSRL